MRPSIRVFDTAEEVAEAAALAIAERVALRAREGERTSIVLAGGTTPRLAYERLATKAVPFSSIDFYFGDERAVPPDDPASNYRMAKEALFDRVGVAPTAVRRMRAEAADLDAAAAEYEALLPLAVDLLLLGMGEDGHTASLFPGADSLTERQRRVVSVVGPKHPPRRLTITPPVLDSARSTLVLVSGRGKAEALARAIDGPFEPHLTPIQLALSEAAIAPTRVGAAIVLTDREAAQSLRRIS